MMLEAEWLTSTDPQRMLRYVWKLASDHKMSRLYTACCRRLQRWTAAKNARNEGRPSFSGVSDEDTSFGIDLEPPVLDPIAVSDFSPMLGGAVWEAVRILAADERERRELAFLIRDIFGNIFRPISLDPSWADRTVVKLAESIYDDRAFDRLPVLADALQKAGCNNVDILSHCREGGEHVRGCWVVDAILADSERVSLAQTLRRTPIYLDYNASTPLDPQVVEATLPYLKEHFGNPSSAHAYGKVAHQAVELARSQIAHLLGAQPDEIVFTGGGTEATNHALKGRVFGQLLEKEKELTYQDAGIIISAVEHPATAKVCDFLGRLGCPITVLDVDSTGRIDPNDVRRALKRPTAIVSIMHANNEVGTLQPIAEVAKICKDHGVPLHTDAAQSIGKVPVNVNDLGVDLLTVAGHKLYAPKGVGALYIRRGLKLEPFIHGAGHEAGRRAGTENVPHIVGLGMACEIIGRSLTESAAKLRKLSDRLWDRLRNALGEHVVLNGHPTERLPNTLNVSFVGCVGSELLEAVPEIAASTGSACHEGKVTQSPVLSAMRVDPSMGKGAVRLSVGRFTTEVEADRAAEYLIAAAKRLRRT
jgi:cysteine desulfurase